MPRNRSSTWYHAKVGVVLDHLSASLLADEYQQLPGFIHAIRSVYAKDEVEEVLHNLSVSFSLRRMDLHTIQNEKPKPTGVKARMNTFKVLRKAGII